MDVAVVGASGYAGAEILRLLAGHPEARVVAATGESAKGKLVAEHTPALGALYPSLVLTGVEDLSDVPLDTVFLALPHGRSQEMAGTFLERGIRVVDLGADYRLRDPRDYAAWYGAEHRDPQRLGDAVYCLVERHRDEIPGASLLAIPGCYPTASSLALGPFLDRGVAETSSVVVNALSGVSGAGRSPNDRLHFPRLASNAEAYGLLRHRHTVEIEREIGAEVLFTPHLVPVARGMLVSAYARVRGDLDTAGALAILRETYDQEPFVVVTEEPPTLKDPVGSNLCFVSARVDPRTGWLLVMSSLDNLVKGAAGQAVQAWNVASGVEEITGLPRAGVTP